jgi:D-glycero-alpha-D-manno-heptose-7-phosphate kinase
VNQDNSAEKALIELAQLAGDGYRQIQMSGIKVLPGLVNESWELKKKSSPSSHMDIAGNTVERGLSSGALAAKLLGAGGGGFVLFLVEESSADGFLREFQAERVLRVSPDLSGVTTIYEENDK